MSLKDKFRKIIFVAMWCMVGSGALVLLIAAINRRNSKACKGYRVEIAGAGSKYFVDKNEIINILTANGQEKLTDKSIVSFNLRQMEQSVSANPWISKTQVFFDNNEILRVNITERQPVARIFTTGGNTFYVDSTGAQLPVSEKIAVKLPVFTNYPFEKMKAHGNDSLMTVQIRKLAMYIQKDSFWRAQIAQVDITPDKNFEMIPMVGNHIIALGNGNDFEKKFHRLFVFYKEVLSKTGFDKYSRINIAFEGQVIGTRKAGSITKADSLQGIKNIQQLIRTAQRMQTDTADVKR